MTTQKTPRTLNELGLDRSCLRTHMGILRTYSLFYEYHREDQKHSIWTTKDYDLVANGKHYPSLKELYLECEDPTEYKFAIEVFGEWDAWNKIRNSKSIRDKFLNKWREELDVRLVSKGIGSIIKEVNAGKGNFNQAKYLIEQGWIKKADKRGRPSKQAISHEATKMIKVKDELDIELERAEKLINK